MNVSAREWRYRLLWSIGVTIAYSAFIGAARWWKHMVPPREEFTLSDRLDIVAFAIICPALLFLTAPCGQERSKNNERNASNAFGVVLLGTFMFAVIAALGRK